MSILSIKDANLSILSVVLSMASTATKGHFLFILFTFTLTFGIVLTGLHKWTGVACPDFYLFVL